jgi:putative endonuclease
MSEPFKTSYVLYIVECSDGTLYTGITNNIKERLRKHNGEITGGAVYTRNKRPVKLVYKEEYTTRSEALKREYEIKQMNKNEKELLVKGQKK